MASKQELLERFEKLLHLQFETQNHSFWWDESHKPLWFDLCRDSIGVLGRDALSTHIQEYWNSPPNEWLPPGKLTPDQEEDLDRLLDSWNEWQYALAAR